MQRRTMKYRIAFPMAALIIAAAGTAHAAGAGGASPIAGALTTVEGWITGDWAEFIGVAAIAATGGMIWLAHEFGALFYQAVKAILGVGIVVFAITMYTTGFGGGATT